MKTLSCQPTESFGSSHFQDRKSQKDGQLKGMNRARSRLLQSQLKSPRCPLLSCLKAATWVGPGRGARDYGLRKRARNASFARSASEAASTGWEAEAGAS